MYSIDDYDNNGTLKPGIYLILATAYTSKFLLFGPLSLIARRSRISSQNMDLSYFTDVSPFEMLTSIPAVVLLFIMLARKSTSPNWMRWVWRNGRGLLVVSLGLQLSLIAINAFSDPQLSVTTLIVGIISSYLLYYLTFGARPRAVFSMFPTEQDADTPNSST